MPIRVANNFGDESFAEVAFIGDGFDDTGFAAAGLAFGFDLPASGLALIRVDEVALVALLVALGAGFDVRDDDLVGVLDVFLAIFLTFNGRLQNSRQQHNSLSTGTHSIEHYRADKTSRRCPTAKTSKIIIRSMSFRFKQPGSWGAAVKGPQVECSHFPGRRR